MRSESKLLDFIRDRDWRIWFGLVITILWIACGLWYVLAIGAASDDQSFTLDKVGNFLEGAFAPLAFLWLVLVSCIKLTVDMRAFDAHAPLLSKSPQHFLSIRTVFYLRYVFR